MAETALGTGRTGITAVSVNYGTASASRQFETVDGNCKVSISSTSGTSADVTISYTLEDDRAGTASIKTQYSINGGGTYSEATKGTGGDNKTTLTTSAAGTSHTFVWNTATDLGLDAKQDVLFRIQAYDMDNFLGSYMTSNVTKISVSNAPAQVTLVSPADGYFDKSQTPTFVWTIPNPVAGNSRMHFKIEFSEDSAFSDPTIFESRNSQDGWEYDSNDAGNWVEIPFLGIDIAGDPTLIANQARFTVPTGDKLSNANRYWRVSAGGTSVSP